MNNSSRSWRVLSVALLAVFFAQSATAQDFCVETIEFDKESVAVDKTYSSFSQMISLEGTRVAYLNLGSGIPVLKLDESGLAVAVEPPLDQWNKLLPHFVLQNDGDIWAYTQVNPTLYRLDSSQNRFLRHQVSDTPRLRGFTRSDWRRRHENRTSKRQTHIGTGEVFVRIQDELFALNDGSLEKVSTPPTWGVSDSAPIHVDDLGFFTNIEGEVWFRHQADIEWQLVADIKDLRSLYIQSPFSIFQGKYSPTTNEVWLMLEDRVLVGAVGADGRELNFDYQFSGDVVIHQPTGQILAWAGDPLTKKLRERPARVNATRGLWKMTPTKPTAVEGYAADARTVEDSDIPLPSHIFHEASGLTIVSHKKGFAAYDGTALRDVPEMARKKGQTFFLELVGGRVFAKSFDRLVEILPDLDVVEVELPKYPNKHFDLQFSELLNGFVLFSRGWKSAYFTKDFQDYQEIAGATEPVINLLGDLAISSGLIAHSENQVYVIRGCQ